MALKFSVDDISTVPEALRGEYTETNGKFVLNVEGAAPKARLDEFRTSNIDLKRQIEEINARFDGVDPDVFRTLSEKAQKEKDKKLVDAGKFDEMLEQRVSAMRADHDKILGGLTKERDGAKTQLEGLLIDGALRDAAIKSGVRPTAVDDVLLRGRQTFKLADGKATAFDGDKPSYGKDGEAMTVSEWVSGLAERAPHLFEPSTGGGAPKSGSNGAPAAKTMTRAQFDALPLGDRAAAVKGMTLTD